MSHYDLSTYETAIGAPASGLERLAAAASHGAPFLAMPILLPFLVWLLLPMVQPSPYVRHQAMQAMLFHLFVTIVGAAVGGAATALWMIPILGWPPALVLTLVAGVFGIWAVVIMIIATWKAFQGEPYRMPVVGGFGH
jgi:uncharacterized membrane protein